MTKPIKIHRHLGFYPPEYMEIPEWFDIRDPEGSIDRELRRRIEQRMTELTGFLDLHEPLDKQARIKSNRFYKNDGR